MPLYRSTPFTFAGPAAVTPESSTFSLLSSGALALRARSHRKKPATDF
jgi:hypothetical protein